MNGKYKGLKESEVIASREKHGTNSLVKIKGKGIIRRFFENLGDPIIKILLFALALEVIFTFGNCNYVEIGGIVIAILIATVVSTVSEYGSEKAFAKIEAETKEHSVSVIRDGNISECEIDDIVVGDMIRLSPGEKLPADGRMIYGSITVDQSALNGENIEVHKTVTNDAGTGLSSPSGVYRGSVITDGEGIMLVEKVGASTFYGMVATDIQSETRESPLKLRLSKLASTISKLGYIVALLVGLTYLFNSFVVDNGFVPWRIAESFSDIKSVLATFLHALSMMIAIVVVAVPEGLPMMITVVLSANMKRMVKDNILVKKLVGIETAGSLNVLFTDKTGTLTSGRLSLDRIVSSSGTYKSLKSLKRANKLFDVLLRSAMLNTDCISSGDDIIGGNSTDRAVYEFFKGEKYTAEKIKDKTAFKSERKYSSVTLLDGTVLIKGAPEVIISGCNMIMEDDGTAHASDLMHIRHEYSEAVKRGERVIAVAKKNRNAESSLTFVALIILKDKIRNGVKKAVETVKKAGIQIVMVTGDGIDTAVSIAEECGIYRRGAKHLAMTSDELSRLSDAEVKKILPDLRVLARSLPQDKTRLVRLSQELELVVGMTGDGINDAPSLKLSDVGFSMGSGTDIAKSAGDIVILDDSFESIAKTVLYGRTIFKSIRKFITFQLIMNLAACGITLIGQFLGIDNPITIIQMLWVNIIMDTLGGLAFAGEPPLKQYMSEPPKRRDEPILSRSTVMHIICNGVFTLALLTVFLTAPYFRSFYSSIPRQLTAFYALFIFAGLANCFTARSERLYIFSEIGKNKLFIIIMVFILSIQLLIVYFGGAWFRSTPLSARELMCTVVLAMTVFVFDTVRRLFVKLT